MIASIARIKRASHEKSFVYGTHYLHMRSMAYKKCTTPIKDSAIALLLQPQELSAIIPKTFLTIAYPIQKR